MRKGGYFFTALIGAIIGSLITLLVGQSLMISRNPNNPVITEKNQNTTSPIIKTIKEESVFKTVAKKAMPSVVGITTTTVQQDVFFGNREMSGVGTGVIIDSKGYILTNAHVIDGGNAQSVNVLFYDGSKKDAKVLWFDTSLDLAIIKVEKDGLTVASLGDSDSVEVGDIAIAIGNPLGLEFERSLTQGIISGLHRSIASEDGENIEDLIQTDASINPGNSGGPLLNSNGDVIGINTAKIKTAEGLGFAIPINIAKPIVDQFIQKGEFKRIYLGIKGVNVETFENAMGTKLSIHEGAYIAQVLNNTPASRAGIKAGDIIVEIQSKKIKGMAGLTRELYTFRPGDKCEIKVNRGGKEVVLKVTF